MVNLYSLIRAHTIADNFLHNPRIRHEPNTKFES
jgi:hypothetical protein